MDQDLIGKGKWMKKFDVPKAQKDELHIHLISESYVGLDVHKSFTIQYTSPLFKSNFFGKEAESKKKEDKTPLITEEGKRMCNHKCLDKFACAHSCCKTGVNLEKKTKVDNFFDQLHNRMNSFPSKKVKIDTGNKDKQINNTTGPYISEPSLKKTKEQVATRFGDQDTLNEEWNEFIEECFTPAFDEKWDEDVWDDAQAQTVPPKPVEKETQLATKISFDVNFDDYTDMDETVEVQNENEKVPTKNEIEHSIEEINKQTASTEPAIQKEVWTQEKCNDPAAWEELMDKVHKHMFGTY